MTNQLSTEANLSWPHYGTDNFEKIIILRAIVPITLLSIDVYLTKCHTELYSSEDRFVHLGHELENISDKKPILLILLAKYKEMSPLFA